MKLQVFNDINDLSRAAVELIHSSAKESVIQNGYFNFVLSGGGTPKSVYHRMSLKPLANEFPWLKTRFFWGDERLVPPDHEESNFGQVKNILFDHISLDWNNVYRIKGELTKEDAVLDYGLQLQSLKSGTLNWPRFDLIIMGMGEDGHTASLFPGNIYDDVDVDPVIAVTADYGGRPAHRITLTPPVFNSAKRILFLVTGLSKATALKAALQGPQDPVRWPVQRIVSGVGETIWFVDNEAASGL